MVGIIWSKKMLEEWRRSTLIPIYKNKEGIQNYANYRGIKLRSLTIKLWQKVIEWKLRQESKDSEEM